MFKNPTIVSEGEIDPEWTVWRKWHCGHFQQACCPEHLDEFCPLCPK